MVARQKFRLTHATEFGDGSKQLHFSPEPDNDPGDMPFSAGNASGRLEVRCDNKDVLAQMKTGTIYFLDLTPVPVDAPVQNDGAKEE